MKRVPGAPHIPGYYWWRDPGFLEPLILLVYTRSLLVVRHGIEHVWSLQDWQKMYPLGEWWGPLPFPHGVKPGVVDAQVFVMPNCPKCGASAKEIRMGSGEDVPIARCGACSTLWQPERKV